MYNINTVLEYGLTIYCGAVLLNLLFIAYEVQSSDKPYEKTGDKEVDDLKEQIREMMVELKQPINYVDPICFVYPKGLVWRVNDLISELLNTLGMDWFEQHKLFKAKAIMNARASKNIREGKFPVGFGLTKKQYIEGIIQSNMETIKHYNRANRFPPLRWYNESHSVPWLELFDEIDTDMRVELLKYE